MSDPLILRPIGVVRSPVRETREMPLQGCRAVLEIAPECGPGLEGLEATSHLVVMGWLHLADRNGLQSSATKLDPQAPLRGVFATRSPSRPNPISLSVVRYLGRDGLRLEVDHLDLVDGTLLVDVKSYAPGWDNVFSARREHRARAAALPDARLIEALDRDLENFLGEAGQGAEARQAMAAVFVATRALGVDPHDAGLGVEVNRHGVMVEALMGLTGAARFNSRLTVLPGGGPLRIAFEHRGKRVTLEETGHEAGPDPESLSAMFRVAE